MVVHSIEIWTSTNIISDKTPTELANQVDNYVQNNNGVLRDQETSFSKEQHYADDMQTVEFEYYRAIIRLDTAEEETFEEKKGKVKQDMENFLNNNFSVWQWRYHECGHDEGKYTIQTVESENNIVNVLGDARSLADKGDLKIIRSSDNNGEYNITSISYDSNLDITEITVDSSVVVPESKGFVVSTGCSWNVSNHSDKTDIPDDAEFPDY